MINIEVLPSKCGRFFWTMIADCGRLLAWSDPIFENDLLAFQAGKARRDTYFETSKLIDEC